MRRLALGVVLGMAVILLLLLSAAGAWTSHGQGAVVVASRGTIDERGTPALRPLVSTFFSQTARKS